MLSIDHRIRAAIEVFGVRNERIIVHEQLDQVTRAHFRDYEDEKLVRMIIHLLDLGVPAGAISELRAYFDIYRGWISETNFENEFTGYVHAKNEIPEAELGDNLVSRIYDSMRLIEENRYHFTMDPYTRYSSGYMLAYPIGRENEALTKCVDASVKRVQDKELWKQYWVKTRFLYEAQCTTLVQTPLQAIFL